MRKKLVELVHFAADSAREKIAEEFPEGLAHSKITTPKYVQLHFQLPTANVPLLHKWRNEMRKTIWEEVWRTMLSGYRVKIRSRLLPAEDFENKPVTHLLFRIHFPRKRPRSP